MLTPEEEKELISILNLTPYDYLHKTKWFFLDSNKFKKIIIEYLSHAIKQAWSYKNDLYIINVGREGSGKSYFSLWLANNAMKKLKNKEINPIKNVVFNHLEWLHAQNSLKEDILIYDEAEDTFNTMKFQTGEGRQGMQIAIRNRVQRIINILNFPSLKYFHPYIRETRSDLLLLNLTFDLTTNKRIFIKALYDKKNIYRILEKLSNTTFVDKENIFKKRTGKGVVNNLKPLVAGIFEMDKELEENKNLKYIFDVYSLRSEENKALPRIENLFKEIFKRNKIYLLKEFVLNFPFSIKLFCLIINILSKNREYIKNMTIQVETQSLIKSKEYVVIPSLLFKMFFPKKWLRLFVELLKEVGFIEKESFFVSFYYEKKDKENNIKKVISYPFEDYIYFIKTERIMIFKDLFFDRFPILNSIDKQIWLKFKIYDDKKKKDYLNIEEIYKDLLSLEKEIPSVILYDKLINEKLFKDFFKVCEIICKKEYLKNDIWKIIKKVELCF